MFLKTKNQIVKVIKRLNEGNIDFTSIFISPIWYTLIKTFYDDKKIKITNLVTIEFSRNTRIFLYNLWFFDDLWDYSISDTKRQKILPIKTINSQDWKDIEDIGNEFYNMLNEYLWQWNKQLTLNISSMIWELLNNISNHSWTADLNDDTWEVIISANYQYWQFFQKKWFIQISFVDSWIWILSSVRKKASWIDNAKDAIIKALECWFTGWTTLEKGNRNFSWIVNAGVWLTTTLEIVKELHWDMFIWTKDCLYCYNWKENKEYFENIGNWKWTFVVFNIYIDTNSDIDFHKLREDLLWKNKNDLKLEKSIDFW